MDPSKRILHQLEQGRSDARAAAPRPPQRHFAYAFVVVCAVVVLAVGVVSWGTDPVQRPVPARDPVFKPEAPTVASNEVEAERLAAAIVNEPLQQHMAAQTRQPERAAPVRGDAAVPATVAEARGPHSNAGAAGARARVAKAFSPASVQALSKPAGTAAAAADSDVALLAALMSHSSGDAVERQPATGSVAMQLRRCARLGAQDAAQCHARACTGHWGQNSACRVTVAE